MISKEQYQAALKVVNQYRKEQQAANYPKILQDTTIKLEGFNVVDKYIQLSPRRFDNIGYIEFPNLGYKLGDFKTLKELGFVLYKRGETKTKEEIMALLERDVNSMFFGTYLIRHLSQVKKINADELNTCIWHYQKATNAIIPRANVVETETGFDIKMRMEWAFWYHNLNLTKI